METVSQIEPPHSNQKHKKGAATVSQSILREIFGNKIGDSPPKNKASARTGRQ